MEWLTKLVTYTTTHWSDMVSLYLQIIGIASIIVKFTPNLKDDDVLKGVIRFVGKYLALNRSSTTPSS